MGIPVTENRLRSLFYQSYTKDSNDCWVWNGTRANNGYGVIQVGKYGGPCHFRQSAHRFAYELYNKIKLAPDICVCHSCDNKACVNPQHLFAGTQKDNMSDMIKKGRKPTGEMVKTAKLAEQDIIDIIELRDAGLSFSEIAEIFNISKMHTRRILNKECWKHVDVCAERIN